LLLLNSQFRAAFDATAFDNGAASLGSNPGTKSVRTSTVTCVWLVGSFWHIFVIVPFLLYFDNIHPLQMRTLTYERPLCILEL